MPHPIVTLTLNPAIDVSSEVHGVRPGHKTRTVNERIDAGGGGINVAKMIRLLGGEAVAVVLAGGVTGHYLQELLAEDRVPTKVVKIAGRIRMCTTVVDRDTGLEYRFVPEGPLVSEAEWRGALDLLANMEWRWLVASGSLPRGVPPEFYTHAARLAAARGARFVLDTSGPALKASLGAGVGLLKPSLTELVYLAGHDLPTRAAQEAACMQLVHSGKTEMVALTLGSEGAMLASAEGVAFVPALKIKLRSSVGAGDGFVGAMVLALSRGATPTEALCWGAAGGAAVAAVDGTINVEANEVEGLFLQAKSTAVQVAPLVVS